MLPPHLPPPHLAPHHYHHPLGSSNNNNNNIPLSPPPPAAAAPHTNNNHNNNNNNNNNPDIPITPVLRQRALAQLSEALALIPLSHKMAYVQALQRCPHLIETESRPMQFIVFAEFNCWSAAERLVQYWKTRYEFFGPDRAFRALTLDGRGALDADDIRLIKRGAQMTTAPALYVADRSWDEGHAVTDRSRLRRAFFQWQTVLHLQATATNNNHRPCTADVVWVIRVFYPPSSRVIYAQRVAMKTAMPIHFRHLHVVTLSSSAAAANDNNNNNASSSSWVSPNYLWNALHLTAQRYAVNLNQYQLHMCDRDYTEAAAKLQAYGFDRSALPTALGGTFDEQRDYARFLHRHFGLPWTLDQLLGIRGMDAAAAWRVYQQGGTNTNTTTTTTTTVPASVSVVSSAVPPTTQPSPQPGMVVPPTSVGPQQQNQNQNKHHPVSKQHVHSVPAAATLRRALSHKSSNSSSPLSSNSQTNHKIMSLTETPKVVARGLQTMEEALHMLPPDEQAGYNQAKQRAPQLVEKESSPLSFLRYCHFDSWAAAKRLASYWKNRIQTYQDRAFLPLLTEDHECGALGLVGRQDLERRFVYLLPNDRHGRSVIFFEWKKLCQASAQTRLRVMFYFECLIANNPISARNGMNAILSVDNKSLSIALARRLLANGADQTATVYQEAFRLPRISFHVVCPSGKSSFVVSWVAPIISKAFHNRNNSGNDGSSDSDPNDESNDDSGDEDDSRRSKDRPPRHGLVDIHDDSEEELGQMFASLGIDKEEVSFLVRGEGGQTKSLDRHKMDDEDDDRDASSPSKKHKKKNQKKKSDESASSSSSLGKRSPSPSVPAETRTDEENQEAIQELHRAIAEKADDEKQAYAEAQEKAPDLVAKECQPLRFLRITSYDVSAAADMVVRYWDKRKQVFGKRAFLPLDQTFEGALERKDVAVLQSGFLTNLPCREDGASVLCCEGMKLQKSSKESRLRCTFYMWSVMAENPNSQSLGFHLLYLMTEPSFDRAFQECLDVIQDCIPARLKHLHCLGVPADEDTSREELQDQIAATIDVLQVDNAVSLPHVGMTRTDLADELVALGYTRACLPRSLDGDWGYEQFVKWQELRVRHEWELYISSREGDVAGLYLIPTSKMTIDNNEAERNERKRRMTIVHSRNKRERQKMAVEELRESTMQLEDRRNRLARENRRLTSLVDQANAIMSASPF